MVAVVVPEEEVVRRWAKSNGKADKSMEDLCKDEELKKVILEDMNRVGRAGKVSPRFQDEGSEF